MPEGLNHSILKSSSHDDSHDENNENRHVQFDKMKEVLVFDRTTGSLMGQTPTKEKAFETISTEGILTPQSSDMDISKSSESSNDSSDAPGDQTIHHFEVSINDTMSIFNETEVAPAPEAEFKLPEFDPAVANPIFSSPEVAKSFEKQVLAEMTKTQKEIQTSFKRSDGEYRKKLEFLKNSPAGEWAKTEQDLIVISSQKAESRFLDLRSKFAAEENGKAEKEIEDLQKSNTGTSETIKNKEVEIKSKNDDFHQIQDEYYNMKKQEMRTRLDSIMNCYEEQLGFEKKRISLEMGLEEIQIKIKWLAEKEREAKESFEKLIYSIDYEW